MSATPVTPLPSRAPGAAFGQIVLNEARLAWRQPSGMIVSIGLPAGLLIIFGAVPSFRVAHASLGGVSVFNIYIPILIAASIGFTALVYLPGPLVSYREQGILRRLSTTPAPASWLLMAQLVVQACMIVIAVFIIAVVSIVFYRAGTPANPGGLVLALALSIAAIFAIGLAIAAVARTAGAARGLMAAALYPLLFFAGLYIPMQVLPHALQTISHFTPLGAAVQAMQYSMDTGFPPTVPLLVLVAYALAFGYLAKRFFRWE
jgi:ABC-2 type transport system permease protein